MPERLVADARDAPGGCRADEEDWAFEIKWDGVRAIAYWQPGRAADREPQPERRQRALPRAARARRAAGLARSGARRRDRRLRRAGPPELRAPAAADARHLARAPSAGSRSEAPVSYVIFDLLLPRRARHDGAALPRAARAAGGTRAEGPDVADARLPRRRGARAAGGSAEQRSRASSPSAWTRPTGRAGARTSG